VNSLKLVENRKINFESIISLEEKFENGVSAFKKLEQNKNGEIIKIVLINNFN
jgi:threonine dehydrogenase-like Zn-dependent dehydrogenase